MSNPTNSEQQVVDTNSIRVRVIPMSVAKPLIIKNHYTHKWSSSKVCFGVFQISPEKTDTLIGAAVYGSPVGRSVAQGISPFVKQSEVLELKRLWIQDGTGKNTESFVIARTFELLKQKFPEIKLLISYADPAAGHCGGIYQATSWTYQILNNGEPNSNTFSLSLVPNPKAEDWIHSRTLGRKFGTHNLEILKRVIGTTFWIKSDSVKNRYLKFLCNKIERKKIFKTLNHPVAPYPKELTRCSEIQEVSVRRGLFYKEMGS